MIFLVHKKTVLLAVFCAENIQDFQSLIFNQCLVGEKFVTEI